MDWDEGEVERGSEKVMDKGVGLLGFFYPKPNLFFFYAIEIKGKILHAHKIPNIGKIDHFGLDKRTSIKQSG